MADTATACARCGRNPAAGWARINFQRYCHGDLDERPTCYEQASGTNPPWPNAEAKPRFETFKKEMAAVRWHTSTCGLGPNHDGRCEP